MWTYTFWNDFSEGLVFALNVNRFYRHLLFSGLVQFELNECEIKCSFNVWSLIVLLTNEIALLKWSLWWYAPPSCTYAQHMYKATHMHTLQIQVHQCHQLWEGDFWHFVIKINSVKENNSCVLSENVKPILIYSEICLYAESLLFRNADLYNKHTITWFTKTLKQHF